ncbi:hypothetical protein CJU90_4138 [Yarrowia sp. C11]|nr:hypothetical protein CKK34_6754 [Yarrowia sp. E02]KAG5365078.1 hypothetical protein CJU90_4138 [Yarrowia sp. C11]
MLKGLAFTTTGLYDDNELSTVAAKCIAMNGIFDKDLKSGTHFMLVHHWNTTKYIYASRNRIGMTFLRPSFIDHLYDIFSEGDTVDLDDLVRQFRLPPLFGLTISTYGLGTGREAVSTKAKISENGGFYSPELFKFVVDVLISERPQGKKYDKAIRLGIPVVHPIWLTHCIDRGALVNPRDYHPGLAILDAPMRLVVAEPWIFLTRKIPKLGKAAASVEIISPENIIASGDIAVREKTYTPQETPISEINSLSEVTSISREDTLVPECPSPPIEGSAHTPTPVSNKSAIHGKHVFFVGLSAIQADKIKPLAVSLGAELVTDESVASHVVVHPKLYWEYMSRYQKLDNWRLSSELLLAELIERAIVERGWTIGLWNLAPQYKGGSSPAQTPFSGQKICVTGFSQGLAAHITKLLAMLGTTNVSKVCGRETDFLLVGSSPVAQAIQNAYECRVPVVTIDWLWDSALSGHVLHDTVYHREFDTIRRPLLTIGLGEVAVKCEDVEFTFSSESIATTHGTEKGLSAATRQPLGNLGTNNSQSSRF